MKIFPDQTRTSSLQALILGSVAPRPVCFASTTDKNGNMNLSPFSFFNAFSAKPPVLVFSSARRVRDNTLKHTLENIIETKEVTINAVTYDMAHQTSLASTEYPRGVSEFIKAGFTPVPSEIVKPFRVKESPVHFECKVNDVIELGKEGGAGNLIICEILLIHIDESVLDSEGKIDPHKIDLVARMGGNWYCRASGQALFEVEKPGLKHGIGVDNIPARIRNSNILTGNELGQLGNADSLPDNAEILFVRNSFPVKDMISRYGNDSEHLLENLHRVAKEMLKNGKVHEAWKVLLAGEYQNPIP